MTIVRTQIDFAVQSKEYIARQLNAQVCKNWYGHYDESALFKRVLLPFPGSELWSDDDDLNQNVRGMYSLNGTLYVVVDNEFRIYNADGQWNVIGNLQSYNGLVKFMANDNQIFVTDFMKGYIYQLVTTTSRKEGDFFLLENASSFIGTPTFDGAGTNDLNVFGNYTGSNDRNYVIVIDGSSQSLLTAPVFFGTGTDDLKAIGSYSGLINKTFVVMIDGVGTPNTFKWSNNNGTTWKATGVATSTGYIDLQDNIQIKFGATTGHRLNDSWTFQGLAAGNADTFKWSQDGGISFIGTNIPITAANQGLGDGILITFKAVTGHTLNDRWSFDVTVQDAFFAPVTPIYIDGYGLFIKNATQRFYATGIDDFSVINALDYAFANAFPDDLVCGIARNEEIFLIGQWTTEIWYDAGTSPFAFARRPNILINWGTSSPLSLDAASNNTLFWLAQSMNGGRVVVAMQNYQVQVISDIPLNEKLQSYSNVDNAIGMVIEWMGKIFYFLTIPDEDVTWVFDYDSKAWRQRTTLRDVSGLTDQEYIEGRYLANCHTVHNGEHYIGDYQSGKIYKISNTVYMDGTMPIINEAVSAPLHKDLNRISINSLQPVFEAATATTSGQGSDPLVMLQVSKDGGFTWNNETTRTLGPIGEFQKRCKFNKIGYGREFIFRIRTSDPIYKVLMGAIIEFEDTGS